ncbi:MAG: 30S ribosomal protein S1 [Candidatus Dadabacteria bacterium]|nr:30S ribosomal protein S1 [Candidatus Dadabacteria bacterium]
MTQDNGITDSNEKSFEELLDESMESRLSEPENGEIAKGRVIRVDSDAVFIDLGFKFECIVPINQFLNKDGEYEVSVGSEIEVLVERPNPNTVRASKQKADQIREKRAIEEKFKNKEPVVTKILNRVKGGFNCDIGRHTPFKVFLPGSQVGLRPVADFDEMVGQTIETRIIQNNDNGIVVSRRVILEEEREEKKKETLATISEDQVVSGNVVKIIDAGAFVDIGGIEGFVPIGELSWGRVRHPGDVLKEGEDIQVKILRLEIENGKITLGVKQTTEDPWESIQERYRIGDRVRGKVVFAAEFGVFVELEPGIEGLVHVSELSWVKNFRHPSEVVSVGSEIEVAVLGVKPKERRISLSLKQIQENPWDEFKRNNPPNTRVSGTIRNVTELGVFVEVAPDMVGLVRPENLKWEGEISPLEVFSSEDLGKEIELIVLNVIPRQRKIGLGVKQLTPDPWNKVLRDYKVNETVVTSKIEEILESGVTVALADDVTGFYAIREFQDDEFSKESIKVGDEISGLVTGFNKPKHQVNLSRRRLEKKQEKDTMRDFASSQQESSSKLGDILNEKLKALD